jgi:transcriptional regulator with XRE-family HTH domain
LTFAPRIGYILQALKPYFILLERAVVEYNIGSKIKELRKARKLTLQDVARETGFSPALISQIENNNVSPPIATLSKIARFFDVKIGLFFEEEEVDCKYEVVRKADRREVSRVISVAGTGHGYTYEALSFRKRNKKMEPFVVTVAKRPEEETLYNHDGEEFLLILKGKAEILLDEERIFLDEGDAVYFDATLKHRLLSCGDGETQVLAIVTR